MDESWPERGDAARVLVEEADGAVAWAARGILEAAGHDVAVCGGPPVRGRCELVATGRCALAEGADVVVHGLPLGEAPSRGVLCAIASARPELPVVVVAPGPQVQRYGLAVSGCRLLAYPPTPRSLVAGVESALEDLRPDPGHEGREGPRSPRA